MCVRRNEARLLATVGVLVVWLAAPAAAVDGVLEINQASVKAAGGFPFVISQTGSYRLTGNLDVTDVTARPPGMAPENTTAIRVQADNVTIDLNGFTIKGPCMLPAMTPPCSPTGSGRGIDGTFNKVGVTVVNGTVRGMGNDGLNVPNQGLVERVHAFSNGASGITATTVTNCQADSNNASGVNGSRTVTNCAATGNGQNGINSDVVTSCNATSNQSVGIVANLATGCVASGNGVFTISANGIKGQNLCDNSPCPP